MGRTGSFSKRILVKGNQLTHFLLLFISNNSDLYRALLKISWCHCLFNGCLWLLTFLFFHEDIFTVSINFKIRLNIRDVFVNFGTWKNDFTICIAKFKIREFFFTVSINFGIRENIFTIFFLILVFWKTFLLFLWIWEFVKIFLKQQLNLFSWFSTFLESSSS